MKIRTWLLLSVALLSLAIGCTAPTKTRRRRPSKGAAPAAAAEVKPTRLKEGYMLFTVEEADLQQVVLPIFAAQVGKEISWRGDPRKVSLRLTQPVHWLGVLDLVCRFTRTHPTRTYQGKMVLKDGWGGELGGEEEIELISTQGPPGTGGSKGGRSDGTPRGGDSGSAGTSGGAETFSGSYGTGGNSSAYSGGDTAKKLLEGTTTRHSGGR